MYRGNSAGLWLDKYVEWQDNPKEQEKPKDQENPRHKLIKEVSNISEPPEYKSFYERWKKNLELLGASTRRATVQGRMIVGLGEESVIETSVTLHRTYGVPYIPGSAIKGMAASYVRNYLSDDWHEESKAYKTVFGTTDDAGYITFFDALYIPNTDKQGRALWPDIITIHHQEYYKDKDKPPTDWDSPTPVPFLSATGDYLIALAGPQKWVDKVYQILEYAFEDIGIGAKTSSGYGRLKLDPPKPDKQTGGSSTAEKLLREIAALRPNEVAGGIKEKFDEWKRLEMGAEDKKRVAQAIIEKVKKDWKKGKDKDWFKELQEFVDKN